MDLDSADLHILAALQGEGRLTNVELAVRVALSPSPCLRRVKRLETTGVVRGYRAVLDRAAVEPGPDGVRGDHRRAAHARERTGAAGRARAMPEVVSCHMVSGTADFLAEVVVPDLHAYEALLTGRLLVLPMVAGIRSNMSLRQVKSDAPLPLPSP